MDWMIDIFLETNIFLIIALLLLGIFFLKNKKNLSKCCFAGISIVCIAVCIISESKREVPVTVDNLENFDQTLNKNGILLQGDAVKEKSEKEAGLDNQELNENVEIEDIEKNTEENIYGKWEVVSVKKISNSSGAAVESDMMSGGGAVIEDKNVSSSVIRIPSEDNWYYEFYKDGTVKENISKNVNCYNYEQKEKKIVFYDRSSGEVVGKVKKIQMKKQKMKLTLKDNDTKLELELQKTEENPS